MEKQTKWLNTAVCLVKQSYLWSPSVYTCTHDSLRRSMRMKLTC